MVFRAIAFGFDFTVHHCFCVVLSLTFVLPKMFYVIFPFRLTTIKLVKLDFIAIQDYISCILNVCVTSLCLKVFSKS